MNRRFPDRKEAGRALARELAGFARRADVLVLALPRGGVPVAREVARALDAPLDVFVVRKLGVPGQEELAMGAIAGGGAVFLNQPVIDALEIPPEAVAAVRKRETAELSRREAAYRGNPPPLDVRGRVVLLVDDGIATGSTMKAAVQALRDLGAGKLVVATPVSSCRAAMELAGLADEFHAVMIPPDFHGVGEWYDDFSQTTDAEVRAIVNDGFGPVDSSASSASNPDVRGASQVHNVAK